MTENPALLNVLTRIADALDRLTPLPEAEVNLNHAHAWIWYGSSENLEPVEKLHALPLNLLHGIDHIRDILLANTLQFAKGLPANNALLWGARGMGKSSLVKSIFAKICESTDFPLSLIEIHRDEIATLPALLHKLRGSERRFILYCDDLSFDKDDASYKSLKTVLDGSIAGRPQHVVFYATSNRRHLMPRDMMENERRTAIHASEGAEEHISLSDRFGLWLGFYSCDQPSYLAMVDSYAEYFGLAVENLHAQALEWASTRGSRSGRVAWQFITDLAGRENKNLDVK